MNIFEVTRRFVQKKAETDHPMAKDFKEFGEYLDQHGVRALTVAMTACAASVRTGGAMGLQTFILAADGLTDEVGEIVEEVRREAGLRHDGEVEAA